MSDKVVPEAAVEMSTQSPMYVGENNPPVTATKISDENMKAIRDELLGPMVMGWRRLFYFSDAFCVEQYVRDTRFFNDYNIFFNVVFRSCVLAFWIVFTIAYFNAKSSTSYTMSPMTSMSPINITISLECLSEYGCFISNTTTNDIVSPITLQGFYNKVDKNYCPYENFNKTVTAPYASQSLTFMACFSTSYNDGVYLNIPFQSNANTNNYLMVSITAPTYGNDMNLEMQMVPAQQKIVYFSQMSTSKQGSSDPAQYSPYIADQFYNGHSSTTIATLTFKLEQFGYSTVTIPPADYLTTLGVIGGFSHFLYPVCGAAKSMTTLVRKLFDLFNVPMGQWYGVFYNLSRMIMNGEYAGGK